MQGQIPEQGAQGVLDLAVVPAVQQDSATAMSMTPAVPCGSRGWQYSQVHEAGSKVRFKRLAVQCGSSGQQYSAAQETGSTVWLKRPEA